MVLTRFYFMNDDKPTNNKLNEEEATKRRDEIARRMLNTSPKRNKPKPKKNSKR